MLNSCFGAGAFFLPKNADRTAVKPAETADDRGVLAKLPVARQGREIAHESLYIIAKMRPLRMPRDLRLLPGRQIGIKIGKCLLGLGFEPGQVLANSNGIALRRELAEFQNLGFEFGNWFFKIEIALHCRRRGYAKDRTRLGAAPKFPSWHQKEQEFTNRNQPQNALAFCALSISGARKLAILSREVKKPRRLCAWFGGRSASSRVRGGFAGQHRVKRADVACSAKLRRNSWVAEHARHPCQRFQMVGASRLRCD